MLDSEEFGVSDTDYGSHGLPSLPRCVPKTDSALIVSFCEQCLARQFFRFESISQSQVLFFISMFLAYKLVFLFYLFAFVASVPLTNNATLYANGLEAQRLNAQFQMLRPSDSCIIGYRLFYSLRKILNPRFM